MNFWRWVWKKRHQLRLQYTAEKEGHVIALRIAARLRRTFPPGRCIHISAYDIARRD